MYCLAVYKSETNLAILFLPLMVCQLLLAFLRGCITPVLPLLSHGVLDVGSLTSHDHLLVKTRVTADEGPTLLQYGHILTNYICSDYFQIRSHSEVLGVSTSTYLSVENGRYHSTSNRAPFKLNILSCNFMTGDSRNYLMQHIILKKLPHSSF